MINLRIISIVTWCCLIGIINNASAGSTQSGGNQEGELLLEYSSLGYHYDLIKELIKTNIPFYLDNEGIIRINDKYEIEASRITERLETRPHTKFTDKKYASLLILLLQKDGIESIVRRNITSGEILVIWDREDDAEVRTILNGSFLQSIKDSSQKNELGRFERRNE